LNTGYHIEMKNVIKSFGGIHALKNVTFKVKPGEIHALVGQMFVALLVWQLEVSNVFSTS
jgi:ABC-type uncharacterized transport system ATPase subunit